MAKDFRKIPVNRLHWYAGLDADCTLRVHLEQRNSFERDYVGVWRSVMGPATWALGCMERWGAIASEENVRRYDARLAAQVDEHRAALVRHAPTFATFNPRSPDQLKDLVFGQLGLKSKGRPKKTATGNLSLDAETLQGLVTDRWAVPFNQSTGLPEMDPELLSQKRAGDAGLDTILHVIEMKDSMNQRSKYGVEYLKHVGHDGRVHTTYKIARTLRTISKDPNLQNLKSPDGGLPPEQDPGVWARSIYVPPFGWEILSLDYGQVELRVAAWLAGDEVMARALAGDFHTATAQGIFGKQEVSKGERRIGKEVNFGIAFGQTEYGLALKLGITKDRAAEYIDGLLRTYKKFAAWRKSRIVEVYRDGQVRSQMGPYLVRRRLPLAGETGETPSVEKMRKHAENQAVNTPIQSTANQICLVSMYRVCRWLKDHPEVPAELNLNVHDALVMYVRKDWTERVARKVRSIMLGHDLGIVQLKVDVERGEADYGHLEKYEVAA